MLLDPETTRRTRRFQLAIAQCYGVSLITAREFIAAWRGGASSRHDLAQAFRLRHVTRTEAIPPAGSHHQPTTEDPTMARMLHQRPREADDSTPLWTITHDYVEHPTEPTSTEGHSAVGTFARAKAKPGARRVRFRLYDDDGILCYAGDHYGYDGDEEAVFSPLYWGMYDAGCTELRVHERGRFVTV